jgi:hypothetical protein
MASTAQAILQLVLMKYILCSEVAGLIDDLNYVYLVTLSNEECRLAFGNQVNDNMVCVDGNYNEGTCRVRC